MAVLSALTVDVEEWFHGPRSLGRDLPTEPQQVVEATLPILELLRRHGTRGTFFLVGEVVTSHPEIVERIVRDGHEVGCHGLTHQTLQNLGPEGFRDELRMFRSVIGEIAGDHATPVGFRAPAFSVNASTSWALPILHEFGYRYDSSVVPVKTPLYGAPGAPRQPYWPGYDNAATHGDQRDVIEFPISVFGLGPVRVPCGGGVYFRALPLPIYRWLLRRSGAVAVFYIHPWETYVATPRVAGMPWWHARLRHHGYEHALDRLERLLTDRRFAWASMLDVLERSPLAASLGN
jgi:polysaccharide deacetylase family protein (PEP-CTERM system associated)